MVGCEKEPFICCCISLTVCHHHFSPCATTHFIDSKHFSLVQVHPIITVNVAFVDRESCDLTENQPHLDTGVLTGILILSSFNFYFRNTL